MHSYGVSMVLWRLMSAFWSHSKCSAPGGEGRSGGVRSFTPMGSLLCYRSILSCTLTRGRGGQVVFVHPVLRCFHGVMEILRCYGDSCQPSGATKSAQRPGGKAGGSGGVRSFTPIVLVLCYASILSCTLMGEGGVRWCSFMFYHGLAVFRIPFLCVCRFECMCVFN